MLNPIEKFKAAILHLNRDWNLYMEDRVGEIFSFCPSETQKESPLDIFHFYPIYFVEYTKRTNGIIYCFFILDLEI